MSLQDCFAAALQNNFDVRVERFNPEIAALNLGAAYGGYDPQLSLGGGHSGTQEQLAPDNRAITDENSFSAGLSGAMPWGMTYNLGGYDMGHPASISESYGHSGFGTNFTSFDYSSGTVGLNLTQPLLKNFWIDANRLQIRVAKNQLKFSEQGLRLQLISTITAVENAYYELIYARENVKVQEQALELAQKQLSDDKARVEIGTVAEAGGALEQDEALVAQSRASLIAARYALATDENTLKNLITDKYAQWQDASIKPTADLAALRQMFDVQDSWSKGLSQRPDLLQARLNLERQGIQLKYYYNQLFPELDVVGSFGFNGSGTEFSDTFHQIGDGSRRFYSIGGQLSIPLSSTKARNDLKAGKATEKQLLLKLKQLEQNVMVEIDNAVKQAQSAWESVDATQKSRLYAEAALKAEQGKYAAGKSTTFTVLQLQKNLTSARSDEIRALANYNEALATLAAAEGSTLQRRNLDVVAK